MMRQSRVRRPNEQFLSSTAVCFTELMKLNVCLIVSFIIDHECSIKQFQRHLHDICVKNFNETIPMVIPSFLFAIQNNLIYIAISHLDAATYQISSQLKILTTAIFMRIILKKIFGYRWFALFLLFIGVVLIQMNAILFEMEQPIAAIAKQSSQTIKYDSTFFHLQSIDDGIGLIAVLMVAVLSGFSSVYFELLLKNTKLSIWQRNIQLSSFGLIFSITFSLISDGEEIIKKGFLYGYDYFIVLVIILQSIGGLLVAAVIKFMDNIMKGYAISLSNILVCIFTYILLPDDIHLTSTFFIGVTLITISIILYNKITLNTDGHKHIV
ncbi:hypothetical protein SNEBB_009035 [Seison nebaliae]|nr:hypothetical protein SNEBB_009035 [Seison nebaliae]